MDSDEARGRAIEDVLRSARLIHRVFVLACLTLIVTAIGDTETDRFGDARRELAAFDLAKSEDYDAFLQSKLESTPEFDELKQLVETSFASFGIEVNQNTLFRAVGQHRGHFVNDAVYNDSFGGYAEGLAGRVYTGDWAESAWFLYPKHDELASFVDEVAPIVGSAAGDAVMLSFSAGVEKGVPAESGNLVLQRHYKPGIPLPAIAAFPPEIKARTSGDPQEGFVLVLEREMHLTAVERADLSVVEWIRSNDDLRPLIGFGNQWERLPAVTSMWRELRDLNIEAAIRLLDERIDAGSKTVSLIGLSISRKTLVLFGPIAMIVVMLYLNAHLVHARREISECENVWVTLAWVPLFPDLIPRILTHLSIVGVTTGAALVLAWDLDGQRPRDSIVVIALLLGAIGISILVSRNVVQLNGLIRRGGEKARLEESEANGSIDGGLSGATQEVGVRDVVTEAGP